MDFEEGVHGGGLTQLLLSARCHRLVHQRVRTGDIADRMQRPRADHLSLQSLTRIGRLLHQRGTECRGTFEVPAVVSDGPCDLERTSVARALDRMLGVCLRRIKPSEPKVRDRTLDTRVRRVVGIDCFGGKRQRRVVVEPVGCDATRRGQRHAREGACTAQARVVSDEQGIRSGQP